MLQAKVLQLYSRVREDLYRCREDLIIDGRKFSSTLLLVMVGFLNKVNVILFGNYGQGKTTIAELIAAIMAGMPYPAVIASEIRGSPELTEEKLIGRLHLGELQRGREVILWSTFVKAPVHIIDEIVRIPPIKQAFILEGARTGRWLYLGQLLDTGRTSLFATANVEDLSGGSFALIPALADRFALGLDALYPRVRAMVGLALEGDLEDKLARAGLMDHAERAIDLLTAPEYDRERLLDFTEEFKRHLERHGFTPLYAAELEAARREIQGMPLSERAKRFLGLLISSLNFCLKTGQKRSTSFSEGEGAQRECPKDCPFYDTPCSWVLGGGSRRQERELVQVARTLAWLLGAERVEPEHLEAIAPFVLWHRKSFSKTLLAKVEARQRLYPVKLEAARLFVEEVHHQFSEMEELLDYVHANLPELKRRFAEGDGRADLIEWGQRRVRLVELPPHVQDLLNLDELLWEPREIAEKEV